MIFTWPNPEIGWKMGNGQLLFQALVMGTKQLKATVLLEGNVTNE